MHCCGVGSGGRGALIGGVPPLHPRFILGELADQAGLERDEGLGRGVVEVGDEVRQHDVLTAGHRFADVQAGVDLDCLLDRLDEDLALGVEGDELGDELHQPLAHRGEHVGHGVDADVLGLDRDLREELGVEDESGAVCRGVESDLHDHSFRVALSRYFPNR